MAGASSRVKWISDLDKNVLAANFEKRGWMKGSSEGMIKAVSCNHFIHIVS